MGIAPLSVHKVNVVSSPTNVKPITLVSLCVSQKNPNRWDPGNCLFHLFMQTSAAVQWYSTSAETTGLFVLSCKELIFDLGTLS